MRVVRVIAITILLLAAALPLEAATLTWDPSTGPNVAGYRVSYGTQPGVYSTHLDVGNVLTCILTPPAGQTYYVVVVAYNQNGNSPTSNEVVLSATVSSNQPPTLNQPPNQSGIVGSSATLVLVASDPENAALTFTATGLPAGLTLNSATRTISGTLQTAATYNVTVTVSDGSLTASRSFTWIVTSSTATPNQPPTLDQSPNQSGVVGSSATLVLTARDPENAPLTFTATGLPAGLSLNSATRTISGTLQTAGTYTVTATVSDGALTASRTFTWTVTNPTPTGDTTAPTIAFTAPTNNETLSGKNTRVRVTVSDAGGVRSVRYSLNGTALTGEMTSAPYNYTWEIDELANGTYQLQARALDNAGNAGTATINVIIANGSGPGNGKKILAADELEVADQSPSNDIPVNGDFDGDGLSDPGTFSAVTGEWRIFFSSNRYAPSEALVWGAENDVPVPADYDGDGRADLAVYRPSSGIWSIVLSNNGNPSRLDVAWGRDDDSPMAFDYDRDGKADLALRRPGGFDILLSSKGYTVSVSVQ